MAKTNIEVFDRGTDVVFLYKNRLHKGRITSFNIYNSNNLKYNIDSIIADKSEIDSELVFESKEAYIKHIQEVIIK